MSIWTKIFVVSVHKNYSVIYNLNTRMRSQFHHLRQSSIHHQYRSLCHRRLSQAGRWTLVRWFLSWLLVRIWTSSVLIGNAKEDMLSATWLSWRLTSKWIASTLSSNASIASGLPDAKTSTATTKCMTFNTARLKSKIGSKNSAPNTILAGENWINA